MQFEDLECEKYRSLLLHYADGLISPEKKKKLETHLLTCQKCQKEFVSFIKIKEGASAMKKELLPDMEWDEYWRHLYNRMERGIAWILISIGAIILLSFGAWHFVGKILNATGMSWFEKTAIFALTFGFIFLLVSVLREKVMTRKHDKYKEIKR
jgi:predicted anti-sigma-YlaC factor YlaD